MKTENPDDAPHIGNEAEHATTNHQAAARSAHTTPEAHGIRQKRNRKLSSARQDTTPDNDR